MISVVALRVRKIHYGGTSVGRDIRLDLYLPMDKHIHIERTIKPLSEVSFENEIISYAVKGDSFALDVRVVVTEKDTIFSEQGVQEQTFTIETGRAVVQAHDVTVRVQEKKLFFLKRTATFTITLGIETKLLKRIPTVEDPRWTGDFADDSEQTILARALFGEARDVRLPDEARIAVGWSIRNRVGWPKSRGGGTYHAVILKAEQYSSFLMGDSNRFFAEDPLHTHLETDRHAWERCYQIAGNVIAGTIADPTAGANHFFDDSIDHPTWAKPEYFKVRIGPFLFYALP